MAVKILIAATTATATSLPFTTSGKNNIGICCQSLQGAETITLQIYDPANVKWGDALNTSNKFQITATTNFMTISDDAQTYRIVKSATASAVAVGTISDLSILT